MKKRTEGKNNSHKKIADFYKYYNKSVDSIIGIKGNKTKGSYNVSTPKYGSIFKDINSGIMNLILLQNFEFKMPCRLGTIKVIKYKHSLKFKSDGTVDKKSWGVNWKETLLLWERDEESRINKKLVYHLNDHTNGFVCKFKWNKRGCNIPNHFYYKFIASREHKRNLNKYLKDKSLNIDFYESQSLANKYKKVI